MKKKILIVSANYYSSISKYLESGVIETFKNNTLKKKFNLNIIHAPGVFELPGIISKNIKKYDAFIALGCVIKGETPHFDFISKSTFYGLMKLSIESKKTVANGILTCLNKSQAKIRSSGKKNKGREAALALIKVFVNE
tara:strand:+ start:191 stop:607 length:417 start_codon:yes stop_codon:yes gene_type:complete